jgi:uncharacterized protein YqgV (UPF0045/DUF77 family)
MQISAQIALYPLRQEKISPAIEEAWNILEENQLDLNKGKMSSVVSGEVDKVFNAIKEIFQRSAEKGPTVLAVTFSNTCPL